MASIPALIAAIDSADSAAVLLARVRDTRARTEALIVPPPLQETKAGKINALVGHEGHLASIMALFY